MLAYLFRRIIVMIPTFIGITLVSFLVINLAPGGPIEQKIQAMRFGSGGESSNNKRGEVGISQDVLDALKAQYGFDKPVHVRYWIWLKNLSRLDFGESFKYEESAMKVITEKFPVSLQFGIASLLLTYLVCVPLGILKAVKAGSIFDHVTGFLLYVSYSIPTVVLGIFLLVFFAGGSYFQWFPLGQLYSDNYLDMTTSQKIWDRIIHFVLPLICYMISGFTSLTMLMRNSMLDVVKSDYVRTARAKGLSENVVLYKHALRNALIPVATNLGGFFGVFLSGSLIVETIFQLDGIGLLSYNSLLSRDYNVIMGLIFLSSLVLLLGRLISDVIYVLVDPRIDFK
jgi:microcin C transport system permease protein